MFIIKYQFISMIYNAGQEVTFVQNGQGDGREGTEEILAGLRAYLGGVIEVKNQPDMLPMGYHLVNGIRKGGTPTVSSSGAAALAKRRTR